MWESINQSTELHIIKIKKKIYSKSKGVKLKIFNWDEEINPSGWRSGRSWPVWKEYSERSRRRPEYQQARRPSGGCWGSLRSWSCEIWVFWRRRLKIARELDTPALEPEWRAPPSPPCFLCCFPPLFPCLIASDSIWRIVQICAYIEEIWSNLKRMELDELVDDLCRVFIGEREG